MKLTILLLLMGMGMFSQGTVTAKRQTATSIAEQLSAAMQALRAASAAEDIVHDGLFSIQQQFEQEFEEKKLSRPTLEKFVRNRTEMENAEASLKKALLTVKNIIKGSFPPAGVSQEDWNQAKLAVTTIEGASGLLSVGVTLDEPDFREAWKIIFHEDLPKKLPLFSELIKKL